MPISFNRYVQWLEDEGYEYATVYLELTTLKQVLKFLVTEKLLPADRLFLYPLQKPCESDTYCWKPDEVQAMLEHCASVDGLQWLGGVLRTLAATGLRIGELRALRWGDVDFDDNVISIKDESQRRRRPGREVRTTKGRRGRTFPIHADLLPVLRQLPRLEDGYVFHGPNGGRIKPDRIRNILVRDVLTPLASRFPTGAGEPGFADGRLHSFRHFFCSVCAHNGVPELTLMQWLGHRDSRMVRHYYHLHDQESHRQMARVALFPPAASVASAQFHHPVS